MPRLFALTLVLICVLLSACRVTPYVQAKNMQGGGYSEIQLNQYTYQVRFKGNSRTSRNQVNYYLLRRAAELTQQQGYRYFEVVAANEQAADKYYSTPTIVSGTSNTSYSGSGSGYGPNYSWSGSSTSNSQAVITPGRTFKRTQYENSIIIKMLRKPKAGQGSLDEETILKAGGK